MATHSLFYQAHLTWAKSVGDDVAGNTDPYNRALDRAMSAVIPPFRAVVSLVYDLPLGKGKMFGSSLPAVLDYAAGGWRLTANYQWENGSYFSPAFSGSDPSNTNSFGGRPDCIGNGNLPKDQRTLDHYFNTAAFVTPPDNAGRYGNCGANILEGPGLNILNFGLNKELSFRERLKLKLEVVPTNVLNHPQFDVPNATLDTPTYGMITDTRAAGRNLSLTLRLAF